MTDDYDLPDGYRTPRGTFFALGFFTGWCLAMACVALWLSATPAHAQSILSTSRFIKSPVGAPLPPPGFTQEEIFSSTTTETYSVNGRAMVVISSKGDVVIHWDVVHDAMEASGGTEWGFLAKAIIAARIEGTKAGYSAGVASTDGQAPCRHDPPPSEFGVTRGNWWQSCPP